MRRNVSISASGFTLIELLTVIAIVGLLAVGLMTVINPLEQLAKSRDTRRKSDLAQVQKALELYYQDNGSYPSGSSGRIMVGSVAVQWGESGFAPYFQVLPKDPSSPNKQYYYVSNAQSYWIFASLDRGGKDKNACNYPADTRCNTASSADCVGICNYAVSSPNVSPN